MPFPVSIVCPFHRTPSPRVLARNSALIPLAAVLWVVCAAGQTNADGTTAPHFPSEHWQLAATDCAGPARTWKTARHQPSGSDRAFERIEFQTGLGTEVFAKYPVPPAFVIPELDASVQVHSRHPGIHLLVRVVLPHTPNPDGPGPLTTLLGGPLSESSGRWETLRFSSLDKDLSELLQERIWVLRRKYGKTVSRQNAYVDAVYLNLYTHPGRIAVDVQNVQLTGVVSAASIAQDRNSPSPSSFPPAEVPSPGAVVNVSYQQDIDRRPSLVVRDGSILEVGNKPFFPIVIQYNGEPFSFLKSLGFNTIRLPATATPFQLQEAEKLDLWLVCPPPPSVGLEPIPFRFDRVLAWSVGENLTGNELRQVRQQILEIRESDLREGRPIVANVESHWNRFGQEVDVLSLGLEPLGTSFIASQYSDWIKNRSLAIGNNKPIWTEIQTEIAPQLAQQVAAIARQVPPTPVEPQQLKFIVFEAIAGGSRGLRFNSRSPLDAGDPATRLRADSIRWVNRWARQLEPWIVGGALMGELETNSNHLDVTAINTSRSRLLLVQRPTHHEQYWAGDSPVETIRFKDNRATFSDRVYRLTEVGLQPMAAETTPSGIEIRLEDCPYTDAVLLTQDPQVVSRVSQEMQPSGQATTLALHREITRQWIAILQLVEGQMTRMGRSPVSASGALNEAINAFRKASELANTSPSTSLPFLDRADERLAFVRREMMTQPLGQFQSKTSTPFLSHISLVPLHWQLADQLSVSSWGPNSLPGGDFENLGHMTQHGWENRRIDDLGLESRVELSDTSAVDGKFGLKLTVRPTRQVGVVQATPVWITSGPVPVKAGQMVRIHGWVRVPAVIGGSHDGLTIMESIGGPQLAERIPLTSGWQEFTLYRGAQADGDLRVTFALTGIGTAEVDEVTIRTIDLSRTTTNVADSGE